MPEKSVHFEAPDPSVTDSEKSSDSEEGYPLEYEISQRRIDDARRKAYMRNKYLEWTCWALDEGHDATLPGFHEWYMYMKGLGHADMKKFAMELWLKD